MNKAVKIQSDPYYISPERVIWVIFGVSGLFQLIIILYNHFTGFAVNDNLFQFSFRWVYGTVLSMVGFALIIYPDLRLIRILNIRYPWNDRLVRRIVVELLLLTGLAVTVSSIITSAAHLIHSYSDGLAQNLINNALITTIVNLILVASMEAWIFFRESSMQKKKAEDLEKELTRIRFEVLKNQINPHFLFNSLNVLSSLVGHDPDKARKFIDEFSMIYRYVLETIEKKSVPLKDELEFIRSYMFLQQIRYGDCLQFRINLESRLLEKLLPPLSLQVVVENAIKHNIINSGSPLIIRITEENGMLVIRNNRRPKISSRQSTGIGQLNLAKRYLMIAPEKPVFQIVDDVYVVQLPLIDRL